MRLLFTDFTLPYLLRDSEYPVGGWAVQLSAWLAGLSASGHRAGILTWKGAADYVGKPMPFDLIDTYDPKRGIKVLKYFYSWIPARLQAARAWRPDAVIQASCGLDTGIMAFVASRLRVPFVYRVANDFDVDERVKMYLRSYERLAYHYGLRRAALILCQNRYQFDALRRRFPFKPMAIIRNPFSLPSELPLYRPREERSYVAWVGVFRSEKNMALLCKIAQALPNIRFRVAGMPTSNTDRATHQALATLAGLSNVEFVGYVRRHQILEFLSGAIALLNTSHSEGFSNTFLESCTVGTPIIARRAADPDLLIATRGLGRSAAVDTELPSCVQEICAMVPEFYREISECCRAYVLAEHAPSDKVEELIAALSPILGRK